MRPLPRCCGGASSARASRSCSAPTRAAIDGDGQGGGRRAEGRRGSSRPTWSSWPSASAPTPPWRRARGVDVNRGIVVDDGWQTSLPGIYAIGECAEHRGACYGLVEPGYEQANVLAARLGGRRRATYPGSVLATNLKVSGVSVFSAGDFGGRGHGGPSSSRDAGGRRSTASCVHAATAGSPGRVLFGDTRGRALVPRPHPHRRRHPRHARRACSSAARPVAGGRLTRGGHERFQRRQKRYLEGFVSGVQARARRAGA